MFRMIPLLPAILVVYIMLFEKHGTNQISRGNELENESSFQEKYCHRKCETMRNLA